MLAARRLAEPNTRAGSSQQWAVQHVAVPLAGLQFATIAAEFIASFAFTPNYDWLTNTISELGVGECTSLFDPRAGVEACSPLAGVMNGAMIFSGICLLLLALVLRQSPGFSRLAGLLWALAGAGSIATGFISLDTSPVLHQLVSVPLFFGGPLAIAVGAFQFNGPIRYVGAIMGFVALVLGILFSTTDWIHGFGGIIERLVIWPALGWTVFIAVRARSTVA